MIIYYTLCTKTYKPVFLFSDIDECKLASMNKCEQKCVNTLTSFYCDCKPGYKLMPDKISCRGKQHFSTRVMGLNFSSVWTFC